MPSYPLIFFSKSVPKTSIPFLSIENNSSIHGRKKLNTHLEFRLILYYVSNGKTFQPRQISYRGWNSIYEKERGSINIT
jgi:hypothetical protein